MFSLSPLFTCSSMGILFSISAILCLRGAFRNVTPCINEKGLYCTTVDLSLDYPALYMVMKWSGNVKQMKLMLVKDKNCSAWCILFSYCNFAHKILNEHPINDCILTTKFVKILEIYLFLQIWNSLFLTKWNALHLPSHEMLSHISEVSRTLLRHLNAYR